MYKRSLKKADGRSLHLYSREPIAESIGAPSPNVHPVEANPHLRWHPLRGEWVAYASHRQNRTFLPPPEYSPLAVTASPESPTEVPSGRYDIAVFDNLFPSLRQGAHDPPSLYVPTLPAAGACEVVVFTQAAQSSLGQLPISHLELLIEVWADRYRELGARDEIRYVMPFENRGVEVGVTLHHPHGQIYAYPTVPPVAARTLELEKKFFETEGRSVLQWVIEKERQDGRRMLFDQGEAVAFVPAFARYPYEVWIAPTDRWGSLAQLDANERHDFAKALKTVLLKFDALWKRPFPYLMVFHQAPTDGEEHPECHFHLEFSPPYRSSDRLKYLAGTELGAGMFANDSVPEEKAAELQAVEVALG